MVGENVEPDHPTMLANIDCVGARQVVRGAIAELPNADVLRPEVSGLGMACVWTAQ